MYHQIFGIRGDARLTFVVSNHNQGLHIRETRRFNNISQVQLVSLISAFARPLVLPTRDNYVVAVNLRTESGA